MRPSPHQCITRCHWLSRILLKKDLPPRVQTELQRMVGGFLGQVAAQNNISSVHFNFCGEDEGAS